MKAVVFWLLGLMAGFLFGVGMQTDDYQRGYEMCTRDAMRSLGEK